VDGAGAIDERPVEDIAVELRGGVEGGAAALEPGRCARGMRQVETGDGARLPHVDRRATGIVDGDESAGLAEARGLVRLGAGRLSALGGAAEVIGAHVPPEAARPWLPVRIGHPAGVDETADSVAGRGDDGELVGPGRWCELPAEETVVEVLRAVRIR